MEILTLITANYFSVLYHNCEVWHLPTLKPEIKQHLLSASANALKLAQHYPDRMESFINIHEECKCALQEQMILCEHAILLHKLYNQRSPETEWINLNFQQLLTSRQLKFSIPKTNKYKVGNNILTNRLHILNNKIKHLDLNDSITSFKINQKKTLLSS